MEGEAGKEGRREVGEEEERMKWEDRGCKIVI